MNGLENNISDVDFPISEDEKNSEGCGQKHYDHHKEQHL